MKTHLLIWSLLLSPILSAHTVVISSLQDSTRPLDALSSSNTLPLSTGSEVRVGAFPGLTSDGLIDAAASGGLAQIQSSFVQFGQTQNIGTGANATPGVFEILVRETTTDQTALWKQEVISVLITSSGSNEFIVARFPGETFEVDSTTALETITSLHLADAQLILGQNPGPFSFTTSPAPGRPSFITWINQYPTITDPNMQTLNADPDGDGRSNFLEYATGGDPSVMSSFAPAQIVVDASQQAWFRVSVVAGLGLNRFQVESTTGALDIWSPVSMPYSIDPSPPFADSSLIWIRYPVTANQATGEFFRLSVSPGTN